MRPALFIGGKLDGRVINVPAGRDTWRFSDNRIAPEFPDQEYRRRTAVIDGSPVDVFSLNGDPIDDAALGRVRNFASVPAFLLKGAPASDPPGRTHNQLAAAMLAYDAALPPGTPRPKLPDHVAALRAAILAALLKG